METWTLVGMMGAGKTSIGRKLAVVSEREFIDTDQLIQNRLGRSIEKIFEYYGEPAFRDHEAKIISEQKPGNFVLSTGGGAIMRKENWDHLKSIGLTIYLQSSAETLIERLKESKKKRPLLNSPDWEEKVKSILHVREPIYQSSDVIINLDDIDLEDASKFVFSILESRK